MQKTVISCLILFSAIFCFPTSSNILAEPPPTEDNHGISLHTQPSISIKNAVLSDQPLSSGDASGKFFVYDLDLLVGSEQVSYIRFFAYPDKIQPDWLQKDEQTGQACVKQAVSCLATGTQIMQLPALDRNVKTALQNIVTAKLPGSQGQQKEVFSKIQAILSEPTTSFNQAIDLQTSSSGYTVILGQAYAVMETDPTNPALITMPVDSTRVVLGKRPVEPPREPAPGTYIDIKNTDMDALIRLFSNDPQLRSAFKAYSEAKRSVYETLEKCHQECLQATYGTE